MQLAVCSNIDGIGLGRFLLHDDSDVEYRCRLARDSIIVGRCYPVIQPWRAHGSCVATTTLLAFPCLVWLASCVDRRCVVEQFILGTGSWCAIGH